MRRSATHDRPRPEPGKAGRFWPGLVIALVAGAVATAAVTADTPPTAASLNAVSARAGAHSTSILIEASEPVAYATARPDPLTVVVDLRRVIATGAVNRVGRLEQGVVAGVSVEPISSADGIAGTRIAVALREPVKHSVRAARNMIEVEISHGEQAAGPATAKGNDAATQARTLRAITAEPTPGGVQVTLSGDGRLVAAATELTAAAPHRLVLDFTGVRAAVPAVTPVGQGPVERVRVAAYRDQPLVTRVVFDLTKPAPYRLESGGANGELLRVIFDGTSVSSGSVPARSSAPPVPDQARGVVSVEPMAALKQSAAPAASPPRDTPQQAAPSSEGNGAAAATPSQSPPAANGSTRLGLPPSQQGARPPAGGAAKQYTGQPVSLDFQGLDLRAVLRVFAEISGLNIVIDPSVQGTVDVALKEVPWDQALDIILRANKLGYVVDGTIVRIAPLSVLADEEAQRRKLADEQALSGELRTITRVLSYAKGEDLRPLLEKSELLSKRGTVQFDTRTNTLIIRDLPDRLAQIGDLIAALDKPELQVEIEARIVRTTSDTARAIGVTWGFNGRMAPELGNTTGLAFPSAVGGQGSVSLPAGAPADVTSKVSLALGSINGSFNLDVALSALEKAGKARVLLQPRVIMQNNSEGYIMRGQQIPYTTAQPGSIVGGNALLTPPTVQFKDAALSLKVTPQVTAAGTVFLKIDVENSFPNYAVTRAEQPNPAIDTQRASTRVLLPDGATTVIGGIYENAEDIKNQRTPALHRVPLLGWLFRNESKTSSNNELLIFITPRIIRMQ